MTSQRVSLVRIIDGDTVEVLAGRGLFRKAAKLRIRLYGMDAPESSQQGGTEATKHLQRLIGSRRKLWMNVVDTDQYGRTVGLIFHRKSRPQDSYNYMMVRDGHARAYMTRGDDRERFETAQSEAARRGIGMWRKRNPQAPWEYRRKQREKAQGRSRLKLALALAMLLLVAITALALYQGTIPPELPIPPLPGPR